MKRKHFWVGWLAGLIPVLGAFAQQGVSLDFSNDVWNQTDRYYTTGWRLAYSSVAMSNPARKWVSFLSTDSGYSLATLDVFQDVYTPSTYNTNVYNPTDRPYASVLATTYTYAQQYRKSAIRVSGLAGLIGKQALGEEVQNGVHDVIDNLHALGWAYQLKTGVLLNMGIGHEYTIVQKAPARLSSWIGAELGTYKTNAQVGATFYLGSRSESYLIPLQPSKQKRFGHQLVAQSIATMVGHDATLQGAWFQNYTYGLSSDQLKRLTLRSKLEYRMRINRFQFTLSQYIQSPDFNSALWHKWVTIQLGYWF